MSNTTLAVAVGNTRIRWAMFEGEELSESASVANEQASELGSLLNALARQADVAAVASVNDPIADRVEASLASVLGYPVARVHRDLAVPLSHVLDEPVTVGVDRVLCALAAYDKTKQACVVIDAGTAITVDLVDGTGVFQGGAIAPGGRMMLDALHAGAEQLPSPAWPPAATPREPIGRNTPDAMLQGVMACARGAVRHLVEQYSELYGAYPQVIATGGDAALLFDDDGLVEHIIPDLQLMGIRLCAARAADEASA